MFNILQINLNRCRAAHDLLYAAAATYESDICVISEPNQILMGRTNWLKDRGGDTALFIRTNQVRIDDKGMAEGITWIDTGTYILLSCYISPNSGMEAFRHYLHQIDALLNLKGKDALIAGDFNAQAYEWGADRQDARGEILSEWINSKELVVANRGSTPTLQRSNGVSWPDITLTTAGLANRISNWEVREDESFSDHLYVTYSVGRDEEQIPPMSNGGWQIKSEAIPRFLSEFKKLREDRWLVDVTALGLQALLKVACNRVFAKKSSYQRADRKQAYWWNNDIAAARRECLSARRNRTRRARLATDEEARVAEDLYKEKKRTLKKLILNSKREKWGELCEDLDNDIWGFGYRLLTKRIARRQVGWRGSSSILEEARKLFPQHEKINWTMDVVNPDEVPLFTRGEFEIAWKRLNDKKAPGPDALPPEIIKAVARDNPELWLHAFNQLLRRGEFPAEWKMAKLIMIEKEPKPGQVGVAYRPICLLDVIGKLFESLIAGRLREEVENNGDLSCRQFGFRQGRSTVDAILKVLEKKKEAARGAWRHKQLCLLVTLDVKNAFNSAPWLGIIDELVKRNIAPYLRNLIKSYFSDRLIRIGDNESLDMTCGVPQGSVLGPLLWNIYYDDVLRLRMPDGTTIIGYADDIAVVVCGKTEDSLRNAANQAIESISDWMQTKGLALAPNKSEALVLEGRRKLRRMSIDVEGYEVSTKDRVKYLGIMLGRNGNMAKHISYVVQKASEKTVILSRLMPNIKGPRASKRRVLCSAILSVLLYGAPVWREAMKMIVPRKQMCSAQRKLALRICSGYRTAPTEAILVIAGMPPIELLADERSAVYENRQLGKKAARVELLREWQVRWQRDTGKANWTKTLIPDVGSWVSRKHGEVNYHLTQVFTGHGCFQEYLHRFKLSLTSSCPYCGLLDTARHTIFECVKWNVVREHTSEIAGEDITPVNVVRLMLSTKELWLAIEGMVVQIMKEKERDERLRQMEDHRD